MNRLLNKIKKPFLISLVFLLLCGVIYPLLLTGIGQLFFNEKANGSIISFQGEPAGSKLIGQDFHSPYFLKGRPSYVDYNTYNKGDLISIGSGSYNYSLASEKLKNRVSQDLKRFLKNNPSMKKENIPTDLLTSSGSGLDPHISPESALIQLPAISKASGISEKDLIKIVDKNTEKKILGTFGEDTVNVLKVNLEIASRLDINQRTP